MGHIPSVSFFQPLKRLVTFVAPLWGGSRKWFFFHKEVKLKGLYVDGDLKMVFFFLIFGVGYGFVFKYAILRRMFRRFFGSEYYDSFFRTVFPVGMFESVV